VGRPKGRHFGDLWVDISGVWGQSPHHPPPRLNLRAASRRSKWLLELARLRWGGRNRCSGLLSRPRWGTRQRCSSFMRKTCSKTLCSGRDSLWTPGSVRLPSEHGYARVRASIYIYIYIHISVSILAQALWPVTLRDRPLPLSLVRPFSQPSLCSHARGPLPSPWTGRCPDWQCLLGAFLPRAWYPARWPNAQ
jgi:hypothetical protein